MRRLLLLCLSVIVAALVIWVGGWYVAAQLLIRGIDQWATARRAEGWQVAYEPPIATGFPTKVAAEIAAPHLVAPAKAPGALAWDWQAPAIRVEILPWRLDRVVLRNHGENRIVLERGGVRVAGTLDSAGAMVRLESGRGNASHYLLELDDATVQLADSAIGGAAHQLTLDLRLYRIPPGDHQTVAANFSLGFDTLTSALLGKAGGTPVSGNMQAELMGGIPAGSPEQAVAAWRDDGGTVEVRRLTVASGGVTMAGNGTLALDNQMRPMGAATAAIRGYDEAIDRLTRTGIVNPRDAQLAKLMLSAIARPGDDGERVLSVPVTGQDGWLYIGPMRLARLEPLKLK